MDPPEREEWGRRGRGKPTPAEKGEKRSVVYSARDAERYERERGDYCSSREKEDEYQTGQSIVSGKRESKFPLLLISSSESEEETIQEIPRSHTHRHHTSNDDKNSRAVKRLKDWDLKFLGSEKDDAEEFLNCLQDCKTFYDISDSKILRAIPSVLKHSASRWFRLCKVEIKTWRKFKKVFLREFGGTIDEEDIWDELAART